MSRVDGHILGTEPIIEDTVRVYGHLEHHILINILRKEEKKFRLPDTTTENNILNSIKIHYRSSLHSVAELVRF